MYLADPGALPSSPLDWHWHPITFNFSTGKHCPREEEAETITAKLNTYKAMINAACVCLILMYAGAWSDSRGNQRKPLVILAIVGETFKLTLYQPHSVLLTSRLLFHVPKVCKL